jgi:hypothetical protein
MAMIGRPVRLVVRLRAFSDHMTRLTTLPTGGHAGRLVNSSSWRSK